MKKYCRIVIFSLSDSPSVGMPEKTRFIRYKGDNPEEVKTNFYKALEEKKLKLGKQWKVIDISPNIKDSSSKSMILDLPELIDTDNDNVLLE